MYAGFAWSKAVAAAGEEERLAKLHGGGFFDVSSDGEEVWLPVNGTLEMAHQKKRSFLSACDKHSVVDELVPGARDGDGSDRRGLAGCEVKSIPCATEEEGPISRRYL